MAEEVAKKEILNTLHQFGQMTHEEIPDLVKGQLSL